MAVEVAGNDASEESVGAKVDRKMQEYAKYIDELHRRHPLTFEKLKNFIDRGNCTCSTTDNCICTTIGELCTCQKLHGRKCECGNGSRGTERCETRHIEHQVRIYDIDRTGDGFFDFLKIGGRNNQDYYDAGNLEEFNALKEKLWEGRGQQDSQSQRCRLITINHLSANVAKLLGGLYDIPGDFFNSHLPGTEAISGRLISRLTSAPQIDFDELYESPDTFDKLWGGTDRDILDGHDLIRESLQQNFLFHEHVGWDYFPTSNEYWRLSRENTPMSSGTEAKDNAVKIVFQFNLTHRVSVYSNPPHYPSTGQYF
jgi:hypothetical protein